MQQLPSAFWPQRWAQRITTPRGSSIPTSTPLIPPLPGSKPQALWPTIANTSPLQYLNNVLEQDHPRHQAAGQRESAFRLVCSIALLLVCLDWKSDSFQLSHPPPDVLSLPLRSSSTSRYDSEKRKYQPTPSRITSGSNCRHLNRPATEGARTVSAQEALDDRKRLA
jgi:hypothetical protein